MLDKGKRRKGKWNRRDSETAAGGGGDNKKTEGSKKQGTIDGSLREAQGPRSEQEEVLQAGSDCRQTKQLPATNGEMPGTLN